MRKIVLRLGLFAAFVLLCGMDGELKKPSVQSDLGKIDSLSQCEPDHNDRCNIVSNCGFETGDLTSWTQSGDTSFTFVDGNAHSGMFALWAGPVRRLGYISQDLPTDPGITYFLTFWLVNPEPPNHFQVFWDGVLVMDSVNTHAIPTYTQFQINDLVATGTSTQLAFGFFNPPDFYNFDDVVVCPTPP